MADVGLSFAPTAQNLYNQSGSRGGVTGNVSPVQDAIKILSFRQPTVLGSSAPVPQALFGNNAPTMQGTQIGGGVAENLLRMLFGGQMSAGLAGAGLSPFGLNPQSNTLAPTPIGNGSDLMAPPSAPSSGLPTSFVFHQPRPDTPMTTDSGVQAGAPSPFMGGGFGGDMAANRQY